VSSMFPPSPVIIFFFSHAVVWILPQSSDDMVLTKSAEIVIAQRFLQIRLSALPFPLEPPPNNGVFRGGLWLYF